MRAAELMTLDLPALRWAIPGILPEGLGLLVAPPKTGKSLLAYQMGVELQMGGQVLGRVSERRPVLYYALEDGKRRSQSRIAAILGDRSLPEYGFAIEWYAPRLGGELEDEVKQFLEENDGAGPVVIIDVLSMVRPEVKGKGTNAYDEDYTALGQMHDVVKSHPGSTVLFVTHDRKQAASDWMTRVTGSRGVTGTADFVIFIDRQRGKTIADIYVTGRDAGEEIIRAAFLGTSWGLADMPVIMKTVSQTRQMIYAYVKEHGPVWQKEIAEGTGLSETVVRNRVADMARDEQLVPADPPNAGYVVGE